MSCNLSVATKRQVYQACVVSLLLYCSECWVPLSRDVAALSTFHMKCIRSILGITQLDIWTSRVTTTEVLAIWNSARQDNLLTRLLRRRMKWLGHLRRMEEERTPRQLLFGALLPTHPAPRKRWRDAVERMFDASTWAMRNGMTWHRSAVNGEGRTPALCHLDHAPQPQTPCAMCGRSLSNRGETSIYFDQSITHS